MQDACPSAEAAAPLAPAPPPTRPPTLLGLTTIAHIINTFKLGTLPFCLALLAAYNNYALGPVLYTSLHGTYGLLWLFKDATFPDKSWQAPLGSGLRGLRTATFTVIALLSYWIAPFVLISSKSLPPPSPALVGVTVAMWGVGLVLHFAADAEKHALVIKSFERR